MVFCKPEVRITVRRLCHIMRWILKMLYFIKSYHLANEYILPVLSGRKLLGWYHLHLQLLYRQVEMYENYSSSKTEI